MRIRRAVLKDYRRLIALDQLTRSSRIRALWLRNAINAKSVYLLTNRERLIAYVVLATFLQRPFVEMLYVSEAERRKGYGELLLDIMESRSLRRGEIWTSTNRSNHPMRTLLRKHEFRLVGRVTGLDRGDAELFYRKILLGSD